jgi:DNA topoisomerase I
MQHIFIGNKRYKVGGNVNGHYDNKYNRMAKLAYRFNGIESTMLGILHDFGTSNTGQCALATLLLMHTGIRVGNEDSAEGYYTNPHPNAKDQESKFVQTYGLTTLKWEHITFDGIATYFNFIGKKSVENSFEVLNPHIAMALRALVSMSVLDKVFSITSYDLTKFIKREVGEQFSPKDFRCMRANLYASEFVCTEMTAYTKKGDLKKDIKRLYEFIASKLNNTPGVCRKSYVWDGLPTYLECLLN